MSNNSSNESFKSSNESSYMSSSNEYTDSYFNSENSDLFVGKILNNYIIIKYLGGGDYSSVWLCYSTKTRNFYAAKISEKDKCDYDSIINETEIYKKLKDNCHALGYIDGFTFIDDIDVKRGMIVLELCNGSVYDFLKMIIHNGDKIPLRFAQKTIKSSIMVFKSLHELGYAHSDYKLGNMLIQSKKLIHDNTNHELKKKINNILDKKNKKKMNEEIMDLVIESNKKTSIYDKKEINTKYYEHIMSELHKDDDGNNDIQIKMCDFGSCIKIENIKGSLYYTDDYRAPEVIMGIDYDDKNDIWALGCSISELLHGKSICDGDKHIYLSRHRSQFYKMIHYFGKEDINNDINSESDNYIYCGDYFFGKRKYIPKYLYDQCEEKFFFFKKNNNIKGFDNIPINAYKIDHDVHNTPLLIEQDNVDVVNVLKNNMIDMFELDFHKRKNINQIADAMLEYL